MGQTQDYTRTPYGRKSQKRHFFTYFSPREYGNLLLLPPRRLSKMHFRWGSLLFSFRVISASNLMIIISSNFYFHILFIVSLHKLDKKIIVKKVFSTYEPVMFKRRERSDQNKLKSIITTILTS